MSNRNEMIDEILSSGVATATTNFIKALKYVAECDNETAQKAQKPEMQMFFSKESKKAMEIAGLIETVTKKYEE